MCSAEGEEVLKWKDRLKDEALNDRISKSFVSQVFWSVTPDVFLCWGEASVFLSIMFEINSQISPAAVQPKSHGQKWGHGCYKWGHELDRN